MANNEIHLYGSVGMDWWDEDYFTAKTVRDQLAAMTGDVIVRINSGGGVATEGQAIYTMLVDHPGKVTVIVDGVAASAASLIAMAGDEIVMRLGAWMLIHDPADPWAMGRGTEADHLKTADVLGVIGNAYADVYAARSGLSRDEARAVMKAETVLDGQMAVDMGFATSIDAAVQSAAEARFDYRMYKHAPQHLRTASKSLGRAPGEAAVMAMIAGQSRKPKGEPVMAATKGTAAPVAAEIAEEDDALVGAVDADGEGEGGAESTATAMLQAERTRTKRILDMSALGGMPADFAQGHIASGTKAEAVLDLVMAKRKENGDVDIQMAGRETARVLRDERETRREGMTMALSAQLRGKAPDGDQARPFMTKSLVEMAAICADWKGPMRTSADRIDVMMAAGHSTSDFPGIFENALNKSLMDRYMVQEPTYKSIARSRSFKDFRVHPMARAGDFPRLQPVAENGEIKFGTFGEKRETAILSPYGVGLQISRQMIINDDLGAIDQMLGDYGSMISDFEEQTFYSFLATSTLASDGLAVWHSTHNNLAGAGTVIDVASLKLAKAAIRKQTSIDGLKLNLTPSILLVGPDKEVEALQMVTQITPALAGSVNPFAGTMSVVVSAQITGNTWYLFADPGRAGAGCFVYGYLDGANGPRLRTDQPFGTQGWAFTCEHDFGLGANDFRGSYKNPGA